MLAIKILGVVAALWLLPAESDWPAPATGWLRLLALIVIWAAIAA
ncbi:MAG: hypothetical protein ACR652_00365 [Methylocystis sp.]